TTDTRAPRRAFPSAFSDFLLSLSILYSRIPVSTLLHFISFQSLMKFTLPLSGYLCAEEYA
ncbi:hypothetical protein V4D06_19945, partial [Vibrio mimicus]|uniref:hypothetical protein n=1 Tax=Vibrio mimicus TaxID=674 RepID=UPI002F9408FA